MLLGHLWSQGFVSNKRICLVCVREDSHLNKVVHWNLNFICWWNTLKIVFLNNEFPLQQCLIVSGAQNIIVEIISGNCMEKWLMKTTESKQILCYQVLISVLLESLSYVLQSTVTGTHTSVSHVKIWASKYVLQKFLVMQNHVWDTTVSLWKLVQPSASQI